MIIKSTGYVLIEEFPLEEIQKHKSHRRLGVYALKGFECANPKCDRKGTRLIAGRDKKGGYHLDVYTDDMVLFTVDHLVPVSNGGSDKKQNKVPMCQFCNSFKGNRFDGLEGFSDPKMYESTKGWKKKEQRLARYRNRWRKVVRRSKEFHVIAVSPMNFVKMTIQELRVGVPEEKS